MHIQSPKGIEPGIHWCKARKLPLLLPTSPLWNIISKDIPDVNSLLSLKFKLNYDLKL